MPSSHRSRTHHQVLASTSRAAVLHALRESDGPLGVAEVSDAIGLHHNTVRGHLDVLLEAGYVVRRSEPPRGPGRPRIVYEATNAPEDGSNYKLLAEVLAEYVAATAAQPASAAAAAGRAWADASARATTSEVPDPGEADEAGETASESGGAPDARAVLDGLVRMLADGGFQPELTAAGDEIHLHHCPFGDLATKHPDVVCGAHLGIIQSSLAQLGGPVSEARLLPLVQPGLCVARVGDRPAPRDVEA